MDEPILPKKGGGRGPRGARTLHPVNPGALTQAYVHTPRTPHTHHTLYSTNVKSLVHLLWWTRPDD